MDVCEPCFPSKFEKERERKKKELYTRIQFNHFLFTTLVLTEIKDGKLTMCWFLKRVVFFVLFFYWENFDKYVERGGDACVWCKHVTLSKENQPFKCISRKSIFCRRRKKNAMITTDDLSLFFLFSVNNVCDLYCSTASNRFFRKEQNICIYILRNDLLLLVWFKFDQ